MARQAKPEEYATRQREILDAALRLIHDKGSERMTISDVLAELRMSKGGLYHYFGSKRVLPEGIVEAMSASQTLGAAVDDPNLGAIDKLRAYFDTVRHLEDREHRRGNDHHAAVARREQRAAAAEAVTGVDAHHDASAGAIIRQGCDEGVFDTDHPHAGAVILTGMGLHLADAIIDAIAADGSAGVERIARGGRTVRLRPGVRADPRGAGEFPGTVRLEPALGAACAPLLETNP